MQSRPSVQRAMQLRCFVFLALLFLFPSLPDAKAQALPEIRVESNAEGRFLTVDGEQFMVLGMNWDYFPIGTNYSYNFWGQPDDFVKAALDREMPLLQAMGVNAVRLYNGIPPRWVQYIYETYGIWTVLNHPMGRYGYNLDGIWYPSTDYSDPRFRNAIRDEMVAIVEEFQNTPGILMWLLGNENNYGLSWASFEIEALPEGERHAARARFLYSMLGEVTAAIKATKDNRPVAIANGDLQYIDLIAEECSNIDILGSNVYRGISARDFFQVIEDKLQMPALFTEFGADAFNARTQQEDQLSQAKYLIGQWQEIYEQSAGKGRVGNAIGGLTFQWNDGWWKFRQEENLDIHDTNASWPNGGYSEDFVEGLNNMNEEWWGICAKGFPDQDGYFENYPRAAYYALQEAYKLDPYGPGTDLAKIRAHFSRITPASSMLKARGDKAALASATSNKLRVSGLRAEFETINTGGARISTPEDVASESGEFPNVQGFDKMQSYFVDFEAQPTANVRGNVSLSILGDVPTNPIDQIFYEDRGRSRNLSSAGESVEIEGIERLKVYQSDVTWDDSDFNLHGFYRSGHYHWGYEEGDFFGLYREANYGENVDIYNGEAPLGVEIDGKRKFAGMTFALGPELWWGANPAFLMKYQRQIGKFRTTAVYHEDIAKQSSFNTSIAFPLPETRKASLQVFTNYRGIGIEAGGLWAGEPRIGEQFAIADQRADGGYDLLFDTIKPEDAFGVKAKLTWQKNGYFLYAQGAYMGLVAEAGPDPTITYTGWHLKDSGSGNQKNILAGIAINRGLFQISPNFLWQKPIVAPVPLEVADGGQTNLRNVLDDPFAVRGNRETVGTEIVITFDPTPATWMWQWDNDVREDAVVAASLGFAYRQHETSQDSAIGILGNGQAVGIGAPPKRDLWDLRSRIVSGSNPNFRLVANLYVGRGEPSGSDPREIHRWGGDVKIGWNTYHFHTGIKVDDWGPYDYHRDFNLTFPLQLSADVSKTLGFPEWFGDPQTKFGVSGKWRSLDRFSPRYCPERILDPVGVSACDPLAPGDNGREWEVRTYLHLAL